MFYNGIFCIHIFFRYLATRDQILSIALAFRYGESTVRKIIHEIFFCHSEGIAANLPTVYQQKRNRQIFVLAFWKTEISLTVDHSMEIIYRYRLRQTLATYSITTRRRLVLY